MRTVLTRFINDVMGQDQGRKPVYVAHTSPQWPLAGQCQGRNANRAQPEAGRDAEAMEVFCSLACSPRLSQPVFAQNQVRGGITQHGLGPHTAIAH